MSEALRLADETETDYYADVRVTEVAAELRRLHAENEALKAELAEQARLNGMGGEREARVLALNSELVEALRGIVESLADQDDEGLIEHAEQMVKARAVLAKVEASNGS